MFVVELNMHDRFPNLATFRLRFYLVVGLNYVEYPKASNSEPWAVNGAKKRES